MSDSVLNKNSLMHSLQCVQAMARMMEAYIADPSATNRDREAFGQLLMDFDGVIDNLATVYEQARGDDERYPSAEELEDAFGDFVLARKA